MKSLLLAGLILASGCAQAQSKKRDWMFLLPIHVAAEGLSEADGKILAIIGRAAILKAFDERGVPLISPIQMQVTERDLHLNLSQVGGWTLDLFTKLNDHWGTRYVGTVSIVELLSQESPISVPPGSPPPPGGQLITTIKLVGSVYDFKQRKYLLENKESVVTLKVGRPGPSETQIAEERTRALQQALASLYKPILSKLPKKPSSVGINAGSSGGG